MNPSVKKKKGNYNIIINVLIRNTASKIYYLLPRHMSVKEEKKVSMLQ